MREELEISKLLSTDIPYIRNRTLVVWGMGNTSVYYYEGLKRLEKDGFVI